MSCKKIAKAEKHFLMSCCLQSIFENIVVNDVNSKRCLKRLLKRNEVLKKIILKKQFSEKELKSLHRKADKIGKFFLESLDLDVVIFHKALLILIHNASKNVPETKKYKELRDNYRFLESGAFTFFNHIDKALGGIQAENIEKYRIIKAEFLAKKIQGIIDE